MVVNIIKNIALLRIEKVLIVAKQDIDEVKAKKKKWK